MLAAAATVFCTTVTAEDRAAIDDRYKWNLAEIYADEAAWDKARVEFLVDVAARVDEACSDSGPQVSLLPRLRCAIGSASAGRVFRSMRACDTTSTRGTVAVSRWTSRPARACRVHRRRGLDPAGHTGLGAAKVRAFISADPRLAPWRHPLDDTLRYTSHTLDAQGEKLLAQTGLIAVPARRYGRSYQCRPAVVRGDAVGRAKSAARRKRV